MNKQLQTRIGELLKKDYFNIRVNKIKLCLEKQL